MEELQVLHIRLAPDEALRPRSSAPASVRVCANAVWLCVVCRVFEDWNLDDPPAIDPGDLSAYRRVRDECKGKVRPPFRMGLPTRYHVRDTSCIEYYALFS